MNGSRYDLWLGQEDEGVAAVQGPAGRRGRRCRPRCRRPAGRSGPGGRGPRGPSGSGRPPSRRGRRGPPARGRAAAVARLGGQAVEAGLELRVGEAISATTWAGSRSAPPAEAFGGRNGVGHAHQSGTPCGRPSLGREPLARRRRTRRRRRTSGRAASQSCGSIAVWSSPSSSSDDAALGQLGRGGLDQPFGEEGGGLLVEDAEHPGPVDRPHEGEGDDLAAVFPPDLDLAEEVEDPGRPPAFVAAELAEPADEGLGLEPGQDFGPGVVAGQRVGVAQAELGPDLGVGGAEQQVVDPFGVEDGGDPLQEARGRRPGVRTACRRARTRRRRPCATPRPASAGGCRSRRGSPPSAPPTARRRGTPPARARPKGETGLRPAYDGINGTSGKSSLTVPAPPRASGGGPA